MGRARTLRGARSSKRGNDRMVEIEFITRALTSRLARRFVSSLLLHIASPVI